MSVYRDRAGQRVGSLEVLADHDRTKSGKVLWLCFDHSTGMHKVLRTEQLIRLDRECETA